MGKFKGTSNDDEAPKDYNRTKLLHRQLWFQKGCPVAAVPSGEECCQLLLACGRAGMRPNLPSSPTESVGM
jgi:hypothetical protein